MLLAGMKLLLCSIAFFQIFRRRLCDVLNHDILIKEIFFQKLTGKVSVFRKPFLKVFKRSNRSELVGARLSVNPSFQDFFHNHKRIRPPVAGDFAQVEVNSHDGRINVFLGESFVINFLNGLRDQVIDFLLIAFLYAAQTVTKKIFLQLPEIVPYGTEVVSESAFLKPVRKRRAVAPAEDF